MPTRRGWALLGARAVTGVFGIAAVVVVVGAAAFVPWPTVTATPPATVVSPNPTEQQRVCPGPLLGLAADAGAATTASSFGSESASYGSDSGAGVATVTDLAAPDNASGGRDGTPLLLSVPVAENASRPPLMGGSQSQTAQQETIAGLAVAACGEAAADSWLVAGSTDIGRTSLVLLSNPTTVAATVDLTVYGESGAVEAPGATGILVQPGSQRVVPLAGLAPNLKSPVVRVSTRGGQVVASLEQSIVRGLEPGGVELVGITAPPSVEQVVSGFIVVARAADPALSNDTGYSDDQPGLRLLAPGGEPATATVSVAGEGGAVGTSLEVSLAPGIVTEVPLSSLATGTYTVRVTADQPVVAAARSSVVGAGGKDFGWFVSSGALIGDAFLGVASGPSPVMHLSNPTSMDQRLILTPEDGQPVEVVVAAGKSVSQPVRPVTRYTLAGAAGVVVSVGYQGDGQLSSFAVLPAGPLAAPITVYAETARRLAEGLSLPDDDRDPGRRNDSSFVMGTRDDSQG
ncbi:DUF5719 family protein [Luethyella okanaganae]|uniref:DUF5719 family protein n=1 Tax=Luethyella okanaganae TaxID=69372 RepID=A0ABW1VBL3_9MICO